MSAPDFRPMIFVQIAVGYLGLRAFTVEHHTRTMALTLTTVPRRGGCWRPRPWSASPRPWWSGRRPGSWSSSSTGPC